MSTPIVNLKGLVDDVVSTNVGVAATLQAKQDVIDSIADAQQLVVDVEDIGNDKVLEITAHTEAKKLEVTTAVANAGVAAVQSVSDAKSVFDANALTKTNQFNQNHTEKFNAYNDNDTTKIWQYNYNHVERLEDLHLAYANRVEQIIKTGKFAGMMDMYTPMVADHVATFMSTDGDNIVYLVNGDIVNPGDYTVLDEQDVQFTQLLNVGDIVIQFDTSILDKTVESTGLESKSEKNQPDGYAGLDSTGKVAAAQLPSYVDDVLEYDTKLVLPVPGEKDKIYVVIADESSGSNTSTYRWTGTTYIKISDTLNSSDIKTLYEANPETNAYTDAEKTKLAGIETGATADQTGVEIKALYEAQTGKILDNVTRVGLNGTSDIGRLVWAADEQTADLKLNSDVTLQLGQEELVLVKNSTGATIANGKVVMVVGSNGNSGNLLVTLHDGAKASAVSTLGITTQDMANGARGFVTKSGKVRGLNTSGSAVGETWVDGDVLYVTAGGNLTKVVPGETALKMAIAVVINVHATNGTLFVRTNGLDENHDKDWVNAKFAVVEW